MLVQRVITAVVLLAVLTASLLAVSPWPLVGLLSIAAACTVWEWLRLTWPSGARRFGPAIVAVAFFATVLVVAIEWLSSQPAAWSLVFSKLAQLWLMPLIVAVWVFVAAAMVVQGNAVRKPQSGWLSVFGVFAVLGTWIALVQLYLRFGTWFLVSLLALIWFADIAAYFVGKAIGKHKLAPRVSPGKTWEGAIGGVLAATIWVLVSSLWPGSFGAILAQRWPLWAVGMVAVLLGALSIIGDLFESLLKRRAGFKDSSQLLPGHGGVYDRIDALLPVAPTALLLAGVWFQ